MPRKSWEKFILLVMYCSTSIEVSITLLASSVAMTNTSLTNNVGKEFFQALLRYWPVISAIVAACCTNCPHQEQAVDKAMVAFKGRLSMKQYVLKKPIKLGLKIYVYADSHNGYICQFECYTGRKGTTTEVGLGGAIIKCLTKDLVGNTTCMWGGTHTDGCWRFSHCL